MLIRKDKTQYSTIFLHSYGMNESDSGTYTTPPLSPEQIASSLFNRPGRKGPACFFFPDELQCKHTSHMGVPSGEGGTYGQGRMHRRGRGAGGIGLRDRTGPQGHRDRCIERGEQVGHKNVASFALFGTVLATIIPDTRRSPPGKTGSDLSMVMLRGDDFLEVRSRLSGLDVREPVHTAYRSRFDAWFAGKAEEAGATLLRGVCVTGLLKENGRVVGVKVGDEEMLADVVVGADGFHSVVSANQGSTQTTPPAACWASRRSWTCRRK